MKKVTYYSLLGEYVCQECDWGCSVTNHEKAVVHDEQQCPPEMKNA